MLFRYALRELRNSPRFCLLFCLNMTLGLTGFIALDAMKRSFVDQLHASAKNILAADLSISARRALSADESQAITQVLPPKTETQEVLSLYSMVTHGKHTILAELKGIEQNFPYYGEITLEKYGLYKGHQTLLLQSSPRVWLAPELLLQLEAKVGDTLRIGKMDFVIDDSILDDSSAAAITASMAPRVYVGLGPLKESGLLQFGSTAWHTKLFRLPSESSADELEEKLNKLITDPAIRISSYAKAGQDNGRMLGYLSDYLGLVSLVALALAAIGASYLFRMYLDRKQTALATLVSLGMTHEKSMLLYLWQLFGLGLTSAFCSILLNLGLLPLIEFCLHHLTPIRLAITLGPITILLAILLGTIGAILVCLPVLMRIKKLNPSLLFQEFSAGSSAWNSSTWLGYIPSLLAFYALSLWQAHSIKVGTIFCGTLLIIALVFGSVAWLGLALLEKKKRSGSLSTKLAITYLCSQRTHSLNSFIALGLGATLINLIPQIQHSIQNELERPDGDTPPSLFLFDIQEDQIQNLETLVKKSNVSPKAVAPMIMARLSEVNSKPFERQDTQAMTREAEQEERSRNRGVNLSYRSNLAQSETITQGEFFKGAYNEALQQEAEISLEQRYAERMGLKLGDRLSFDVQGLTVSGLVSSFRSVKWNTFDPNFFILLQPGLVDDAPKTFLMTLPSLKFDAKVNLQKAIIDEFPNISMIDVSQLVGKLNQVIAQMSLVLILMGWLTVLTGHAVIFSIAQNQAAARRWDCNLLKILGADFQLILKATLKEFGLLGAGSAVLGSLLGLTASYVIAKFLFKGIWQASLFLPLVISIGLIFVCLITSYFATQRILAEKPLLSIDD